MEKGKIKYVEVPEELTPDLPTIEGKAYKRKSDGKIFYGCVYLGKLFYLNGKKLKKPIQETPEDFELIDLEENN
ncbi:MAG: hypothetical protein ACK5LF_21360 [Bacteroides xylanisolvens]